MMTDIISANSGHRNTIPIIYNNNQQFQMFFSCRTCSLKGVLKAVHNLLHNGLRQSSRALSHRLNTQNATEVSHKYTLRAHYSKPGVPALAGSFVLKRKLCLQHDTLLARLHIMRLALHGKVPHVCRPDHKTCDSCKRIEEDQHGIQGWVHT